MKKNVLVIGGSGFLGSHTSDQLTEDGYQVTIFDKEPSKWIKKNQNMIVGDFLDYKKLTEAMRNASIVYHFGAMADIGETKINPRKTIEANIMGTLNILEAIKESSIERLMYASSAYVYSDKGSFYRVSKQSSEGIIEEYSKVFGIKFTFLRYGSLYGARSQEWNGIKKFINEIIHKGQINYAGNGKEIREYINVLDAAKISRDLLADKYTNQAIMITGQQSIKSEDLFNMIFEILHSKPKVNYLNQEYREDHYGNTPYRYSPKPAKKIFPLEFIDLGQGILDLVEEIKNEQESENDK